MPDGTLSEVHQELLDYFEEVTVSGNRTGLIELLESLGWDLEKAISLYFERGLEGAIAAARPSPGPRELPVRAAAAPPAQASTAPRVSLLEELNRELVTDAAPQVPPQTTYATGPIAILTWLSKPFRLVGSLFNSAFFMVSTIFPFLPRLVGYHPADGSARRTGMDQHNPKRLAARYIRSFEDSYGTNSLPFFEGGYQDALSQAKRDLKFLVTVLSSRYHEQGPEFSKKVLLDDASVALLRRDDIILWGGSVNEPEGYQLANGLKASAFPFVALIGPSPRTPQSNTVVMEVLARYNGAFTDPQKFVRAIEELTENHGPRLMSLRLDRERTDADRILRESQNDAYERSLAADRARELERQRDAEAQQEQIREREAAEAAAASYEANLIKWKARTAARFGSAAEPAGQCARLQIKLPGGGRAVSKFSGDDDISVLYEYALSYGTEPDASAVVPESFVPRYDFVLVSPMPRKELPTSGVPIKYEPAVWPNGSLVLELNDDD